MFLSCCTEQTSSCFPCPLFAPLEHEETKILPRIRHWNPPHSRFTTTTPNASLFVIKKLHFEIVANHEFPKTIHYYQWLRFPSSHIFQSWNFDPNSHLLATELSSISTPIFLIVPLCCFLYWNQNFWTSFFAIFSCSIPFSSFPNSPFTWRQVLSKF